jgi:hypothetical protein
MPLPESIMVKACNAGGIPTCSRPPWPGQSTRASEPPPRELNVSSSKTPVTQSK